MSEVQIVDASRSYARTYARSWSSYLRLLDSALRSYLT